ncbi:unnamed protein product, partial [Iphiclides podalirius]
MCLANRQTEGVAWAAAGADARVRSRRAHTAMELFHSHVRALRTPRPADAIIRPPPQVRSPYEAQLEPTRHYYARQPAHSASMIEPRVTEPSDSSSEQRVAEVIYARPNKRGGFTYRRPAQPRPRPQDPIVIRVHKYKVVKSR